MSEGSPLAGESPASCRQPRLHEWGSQVWGPQRSRDSSSLHALPRPARASGGPGVECEAGRRPCGRPRVSPDRGLVCAIVSDARFHGLFPDEAPLLPQSDAVVLATRPASVPSSRPLLRGLNLSLQDPDPEHQVPPRASSSLGRPWRSARAGGEGVGVRCPFLLLPSKPDRILIWGDGRL